MTLLIQCMCLAIVVVAIVLNRAQIGNPNYPLIILGLSGAIWLIVALYLVAAYAWMLIQQQLVLSLLSLSAYLNIVLAMIFLSVVGVFIVSSQRVPPIHDITTDIDNPPVFTYATELRHAKHNSLQYDKTITAQQQKAYPQLQPVIIDVDMEWLRENIPVVVASLGWQSQQQYTLDNKWYVEALDRSALLGFIDDVVLRIQPLDNGKHRVDMRSASRIGVSDLGANAQRISQFFQALDKALNER